MTKHHLGVGICLAGGLLACSNALAPNDKAFGDIISLDITAGFAQQQYSVDSSAKFSFVIRNRQPRDVLIYGTNCIINLELENMQGVIVYPSGVRPCLPPVETLRIFAADSTIGSTMLSGAHGDPSKIGLFALPAGVFRMRVLLEGVTDTTTYNPVRVQSAWSEPFTVLP